MNDKKKQSPEEYKQMKSAFDHFECSQEPFVGVPKTLYEDTTISANAVYAWGRIKSFHPNFKVKLSELHKHTPLGRDACRKATNELQLLGYLTKHANPQNPDGSRSGFTNILHWEPVPGSDRTFGKKPQMNGLISKISNV